MLWNSIYKVFNLLVLISILTFTNSACNDKCKDTICENGICVKGDCFCDKGFSGEFCDIAESRKFVGEYIASIPCFGKEGNPKIKIYDIEDNPWDITLRIDNYNSVVFELNCHVKKDSLFIEKQFVEKIHLDGRTVTDIIYPSKGFIKNDSILSFNLVFKKVEAGKKFICEINAVKKSK